MQHSEMSILRHQVFSPRRKSTIYKFIIIRVCRNQFHVEMRVYQSYILPIQNQQHNILCHRGRYLLTQYLLIFIQYLVRNTKLVFTCQKCIPYRAIGTFSGKYLQQAIRINNDQSHTYFFDEVRKCEPRSDCSFCSFHSPLSHNASISLSTCCA